MINESLKEVIIIYWPTLVIVLSIVIILRLAFIMRSEKKFVIYEEIFALLFLSYILLLFQLAVDQDITGGGTNLVPFKEILRYQIWSNEFYRQVIGNILLFVPLGYFATKYCKIKKIGGIVVVMLLSSGIIEIVQHFIGRCFDIDDIILNLVGGILGFLIFILFKSIGKRMPDFLRKDGIKNVFSVALLIIIVLYLIELF